MKTIDVVTLHTTLLRLQETTRPNTPLSVKFAYAVKINTNRTAGVFEAYKASCDPQTLESFSQYEAARKEYVESVCERNEDGSPVVRGNEYVVKDMAALNAKLVEIKASFPTLDDDVKNHNEKVLALNNEPADVNIYKVSINDMPAELPLELMDGLIHMIKEE